MTWRELFAGMTQDELDTDVSVHDPIMDEFYPVSSLERAEDSDVLDEGHPYLVLTLRDF